MNKNCAYIITTMLVLGGCGGSDGDTVSESTSTVPSPVETNETPVANAGSDISIMLGDSVDLDGSNSTDADGDSLSYQWVLESIPLESSLSSDLESAEDVTFTPDVEGTYTVSLVVSDGESNSEKDTVEIEVGPSPIAVSMESNYTAEPGEEVIFDASESDLTESETITFSWRITSSPEGSSFTAPRFDSETSTPTIVADKFDLEGTYEFELVISDGTYSSDPFAFKVEVAEINTPPEVTLVSDEFYTVAKIGYLYSKVEDNDEEHTYSWTFENTPEGSSLGNEVKTGATLEFVPDVSGEYTVQLVVSDGELSSDPKTALITVSDFEELGLQVVAPKELFGKVGQPVIVDLSDSISPNGSELSYNWTVSSGPSGSRPSLTRSLREKSWTEFEGNVAGNYRIRATVTDGESTSESFTILITLTNGDLNPIAMTSHPEVVSNEALINLNGESSYDKESDLVSYLWNPRNDDNNEIVNAYAHSAYMSTLPKVSLEAPVPGYYSFSLKASGEEFQGISGDIAVTTVHVYNTLKPLVANAGYDLDKTTGSTALLDGSKTTGIETEGVSFDWSIVSRPYNSVSNLENSDTLSPTLLIDADGRYVIQLTLFDELGIRSVDHVTIMASANAAPVANAGDDIVTESRSVTLDGSASFDPEEGAINFAWAIVGADTNIGDAVSINDVTSEMPEITFSDEFSGTVVIGLIVNDGEKTSERDEVIVTIE